MQAYVSARRGAVDVLVPLDAEDAGLFYWFEADAGGGRSVAKDRFFDPYSMIGSRKEDYKEIEVAADEVRKLVEGIGGIFDLDVGLAAHNQAVRRAEEFFAAYLHEAGVAKMDEGK